MKLISATPPLPSLTAALKVLLISPYEIGRQSFNIAQAAAWLDGEEFDASCLDLSVDTLKPEHLDGVQLIAIHLPMHTATRLAMAILPRIQTLAPSAHVCVFGLYAPMNESLLRRLGAKTVLGGECDAGLLALGRGLRAGETTEQTEAETNLKGIAFRVPDRSGLPELSRYAGLRLPGGNVKIVGFADSSRGCKYLCRHCPVVPVYQGRFRVVPVDVVMADIRQQVDAGAEHISFGDPDFLNGPTHALRLVTALHGEFPQLTFDATIKIEHLVKHGSMLPTLRECGCNLIISAVEATDNTILEHLKKGHTVADFRRAVELVRENGIALAPTFVTFTPWTSVQMYVDLLSMVAELGLVNAVSPVQLSIRLLIPAGSHLLHIPGFQDYLGEFDEEMLGYPWRHPDPKVDALHDTVRELVSGDNADDNRHQTFLAIWTAAHETLNCTPPPLPPVDESGIPRLTEPWYCCAEPTDRQLEGI